MPSCFIEDQRGGHRSIERLDRRLHRDRDALVCGKEITDVGLVAIRSGDFDRVVRDSMAELDQELQSSIDSASDIIRLLENRKEEEAYNQLAQLLDSVRIFFTIFSEDLGWADAPGAVGERVAAGQARARAPA